MQRGSFDVQGDGDGARAEEDVQELDAHIRDSGIGRRFRTSVEVRSIEDDIADATTGLYRDAVRLRHDRVLLALLETVDGKPFDVLTIARCRAQLRTAARFALGPAEILTSINQKLVHTRRPAVGVCALLRPRERRVEACSAGGPAPWILRRGGRLRRAQLPPSIELGALHAARYGERALHFDEGDALLLATPDWAARLESTAVAAPNDASPSEWIQRLPGGPSRGGVLCLSAV